MNEFQVRRCDPTELQSALRLLHEGLSPDLQVSLVQTLDLIDRDRSVFRDLLVATAGDKLMAATWVQHTPGNAAILWPPDFANPAAVDLMLKVDHVLKEQGTALAQLLVAASEMVDENLLASANFHRLVDLSYYTLERSSFPDHFNQGKLTFIPGASDHPQRLQALIRQSYIETQDCPELNDLRNPAEVIEGYKAQGSFDGDDWFIVEYDGSDMGVLILTTHPPGENCELVYMGVVPEARGRGLGEQVVRFAVERTRLKKCERLVLAVDERNQPALRVYRRLGFALWDRRTVYARLCKR